MFGTDDPMDVHRESQGNVIDGDKPERMWSSIVDNTPMRGDAIEADKLIAAVAEENPDISSEEIQAFLDELVKQKSIRRNSDEGFGDEYQMMSEGESRHSIPDFFDSDEEKEMIKKMSNKEFYNYVTRDKHLVPDLKGDMDEIPGMEGPFQFRSGAVLYYDPKAGKYYDRGKDMYLDNEEASRLTMEKLKAKLSEVFAKYPQLSKNEYFINSLREGVKNKLMEKNEMKLKKKTEGKSLGDVVAKQVRSKLQEGFGGLDDEFGFDDEYGEPSEEDEMIAQLLKKYNLDGDAAPTDADAEAAAERDSMGEFDAEAEDDEDPTVMKEEDNDEDGDGDVDSDDYMAKKDKAIKKAMGKEDDDESVEEDTGAAHSQLRHSRLNETLMRWATK